MTISTRFLQMHRELKHTDLNPYMDWAVGQLTQGIESNSLLILAGLPSPLNPFEVYELFNQALDELQIPVLKGNDAIKAYIFEFLSEMVTQKNSSEEMLLYLKDFYIELQSSPFNERLLYDFYLLYYAMDDFKHSDFSTHIPDLKKTDLVRETIQTAKDWITNYSSQGKEKK